MESGWCRLHCKPFSGAQLLELWYRVLEALLYLLLTRVIWSSHADLSGSGAQANRSVFNTLTRHSPLAAASCSTSVISLHLGNSASLSSRFSSSCMLHWFPLFSLSVLPVWSLEQKWLHEPTCNVKILHRTQMGQDVYIYGVRTYQTYICTYI